MRHLLSILFLICFAVANGQTPDSSATENNSPWTLKTAKKYWKFSPLDIFSVVPTFGADVEVEMRKSFAVQAGVGVIPPFFQFLSNEAFSNYDWMGGYKLRVEGKLYMPVKTNRYFSLGLSFRHIIIQEEIAIGMEPFTTNWGGRDYAYFQTADFVFNRLNTNLDVKLGFQKIKAGGLVLDFYTGLSLRSVKVGTNTEIPTGGEIVNMGGMWRLTDNYRMTYPTPIVGFKIGFTQ